MRFDESQGVSRLLCCEIELDCINGWWEKDLSFQGLETIDLVSIVGFIHVCALVQKSLRYSYSLVLSSAERAQREFWMLRTNRKLNWSRQLFWWSALHMHRFDEPVPFPDSIEPQWIQHLPDFILPKLGKTLGPVDKCSRWLHEALQLLPTIVSDVIMLQPAAFWQMFDKGVFRRIALCDSPSTRHWWKIVNTVDMNDPYVVQLMAFEIFGRNDCSEIAFRYNTLFSEGLVDFENAVDVWRKVVDDRNVDDEEEQYEAKAFSCQCFKSVQVHLVDWRFHLKSLSRAGRKRFAGPVLLAAFLMGMLSKQMNQSRVMMMMQYSLAFGVPASYAKEAFTWAKDVAKKKLIPSTSTLKRTRLKVEVSQMLWMRKWWQQFLENDCCLLPGCDSSPHAGNNYELVSTRAMKCSDMPKVHVGIVKLEACFLLFT